MTMITSDMQAIFPRAGVSYVATICADGSPNLSPKATVMPYDADHLVFMNQDSPATFANLRRDPRVEINTVDPFARRGYRFKGRAEIVPAGEPVFEWLQNKLLAIIGPGYPMHEAALVHIEHTAPVNSPAYGWGDASETELVAAYAQRYVHAAGLSPEDLKVAAQ